MKRLLLFLCLVFLIPISITNKCFKMNKIKHISGFLTNNNEIKIRVLKSDGSIETINLEDYIIGVVSSEMPITFEDEALKAQAVASRTYALKQMENNKDKEYDVTDDTLSQVYSSNDSLKEKWGSDYNTNYNKIKDVVNSTKGEYVSYNDDYIYAFFFSTTNGKTEDNKNVFGADLPYLKVVDSSFDEEESPSFFDSKTYSKEDFYNCLELEYQEELKINNLVKTESGRVYSLDINDNYFKGRDFQKKLSLRSNDFEIVEEDNNIIINTKGFGHGVGLSQYGANSLAKNKKTYQEILKYYYQNTEIKKL